MQRAKVLICDDNPAVAISLTGYLESENIEVVSAETGEEALEKLRCDKYDLVVLDIMLPGISGIDCCREIRKNGEIPIIMLSAKGDEIDRVIGLEVGADDYVTKPFFPREVVIRIKKLLSRVNGNMSNKINSITYGNLKIFPDSYEVFAGEELINTTPREFKLLCCLAENVGHVKSRDQIISEIWGIEFEGETRVLDILVNRLRSKLSAVPKPGTGVVISTVFGIGYRLDLSDES